jgi:hypothetical protein
MIEQFRPQDSQAIITKMKIDGLTPEVRSYMAIGEALKNITLSERDVRTFKQRRLKLVKSFSPQQVQELSSFINYITKVDNHNQMNKHPKK